MGCRSTRSWRDRWAQRRRARPRDQWERLADGREGVGGGRVVGRPGGLLLLLLMMGMIVVARRGGLLAERPCVREQRGAARGGPLSDGVWVAGAAVQVGPGWWTGDGGRKSDRQSGVSRLRRATRHHVDARRPSPRRADVILLHPQRASDITSML